MRKDKQIRTTLRFRRWSHKAYAAFVSIGRYATIGSLRYEIADSSLAKQKSVTAIIILSWGRNSHIQNDGASLPDDDETVTQRELLAAQFLYAAVATSSPSYASSTLKRIHYTIMKRRIVSMPSLGVAARSVASLFYNLSITLYYTLR
ncbi:MAG: hypothetical protein ACRCZZ_03350 [Phocaeicola sp.]